MTQDIESLSDRFARLNAEAADLGYVLKREDEEDEHGGQPATLTYTNYRGECRLRTITPLELWYGCTDWHSQDQWFIKAFDHEKGATRDFALKDFGHPPPEPVAPDSDLQEAVATAITKALFEIKPYGKAENAADAAIAVVVAACAGAVNKRLRDYVNEHGMYDPSTGETEFPGTGDEYVEELEAITDILRALACNAAQPGVSHQGECPERGQGTEKECAR